MPVHIDADLRPVDQQEFARIAYNVMEHAFAVHNELGRFFDEEIYRDALAARLPSARTEVLVEVRFEDFRKRYYVDLLVDGGVPFELKTVAMLGAPHRAQLLNYLLLTGLRRGKVVNFRPELVEHEFVNTNLELNDRTSFEIDAKHWDGPPLIGRALLPWMTELLLDIGTGLHVNLYESAVSHFFGREDVVLHVVDVLYGGKRIGCQKVRLGIPGWAFKVTALDGPGVARFRNHAIRFLSSTKLEHMLWINIVRKCVVFTTLKNER